MALYAIFWMQLNVATKGWINTKNQPLVIARAAARFPDGTGKLWRPTAVAPCRLRQFVFQYFLPPAAREAKEWSARVTL